MPPFPARDPDTVLTVLARFDRRSAMANGWTMFRRRLPAALPNDSCVFVRSLLSLPALARIPIGPVLWKTPMSRLSEAIARNLDPVQAAVLVRVVTLQAKWQNLKDDGHGHSIARLHSLQQTFESFRISQTDYIARYRAEPAPDLALKTPKRLEAWCHTVQTVIQRAAAASSDDDLAHVATRAYALADWIAKRLGTAPVDRKPQASSREGVLADLEAVRAWCANRTLPVQQTHSQTIPSYETPAAR
jgi:hypothetical protein